jgi:hypothetical protein
MKISSKVFLVAKTVTAALLILVASQTGDATAQGSRLSHADSVLAIVNALTQKEPSSIKIPIAKCLTDLIFEAYRIRRERKLPISVQADNIANQVSMVTPERHFTIYYDTAGVWASTADYAQSVARTADSAYDFEINELHYPKPPFGDADSTFHLHIVNQPGGIYGYTSPTADPPLGTSPSGRIKQRTYMVIDNDFAEATYPTHGSDAMHVTVYHEFQHIIQYGTYGVDPNAKDAYFKELTSVWMETRSHPEVKDYLQYLNSYFTLIDLSFNGSVERGYGEAIFFQFLEKRFGDAVTREIWQQYSDAQPDPVFAIQDVLARYSSSFCSEYKRFGNDLFFTGRRFSGQSLFPDARSFPVDSLKALLVPVGVSTNVLGAVVASINYFYTGFGRDTVAVTVARDTNRGVISDAAITIISPTRFAAVYQNPESFCDTISGYSPILALAFPQPFLIGPSRTDSVSILASSGRAPVSVALDIYGINMEQIAHFENKPQPFTGEFYVTWSGRDDAGRLVPSGIYLYTINTDGTRRVGKLAVVHVDGAHR